MTPFFSVIVPTHERPFELNRAVHSVLLQTYPDFELIIVNNGSRELTIPCDDIRIRILSEKRKGANFARNTGIENAQGQFICFLDDDDIYLDNHLETLYDLIQSHDRQVAMYRTFTKIEMIKGKFMDQEIAIKNTSQSVLDHIYSVLL